MAEAEGFQGGHWGEALALFTVYHSPGCFLNNSWYSLRPGLKDLLKKIIQSQNSPTS